MMNDALMQKKSRHNNTNIHLTDYLRRALLMLLLLVVSGGVWGQISNISTGAIDSSDKIAEYNQLRSDYPINVSSSLPAFVDWTGGMVKQSSGTEHWNGSTGIYFEQTTDDWLSNNGWTNSKSTTVHLPQGKYVLIGACRSGTDVNAYISVNGTQVRAPFKGATGLGIDVNGNPSFSGGTYANSNNGYGWEYRYIKFEVTAANGDDVPLEIGGSTEAEHQWMSFTQPLLLTNNNLGSGTIDGESKVVEYNSIKSTYTVDASFLVPAITSWGGGMPSPKSNEHWSGTAVSYADQWYASTALDKETDKKNTTLTLPKGKYVLLVPARGSAGVTLSLKVGDNEVTMEGAGNSTKGITTSGDASFNEGTFANTNGRGWMYFYTKFEVTDDGTNVDVTVSGSSSDVGKWMSFSTPTLLTTSENESFSDTHTFELYNTGKYLNLTDGGAAVSSTPQPLYIVKTSGDRMNYITDGTHYLGYSGSSDSPTTSTSAADKKAIFIEDMSGFGLSGYFTMSCVENKYVGVDYQNNSTVCIVNRGRPGGDADNYNLWRIQNSYDLTKEMYTSSGCAYGFGASNTDVYGDMGVHAANYADLSAYSKLELTVTDGTPRLLFNRVGDTGSDYIEINSASSPYVAVDGNRWVINLAKMVSDKGFAHLNCIKGEPYGTPVTISSVDLRMASQADVFSELYHEWNGTTSGSSITIQNPNNFVWEKNELIRSGDVIYGHISGGVPVNQYADLSAYDRLVVTYDNTKAIPRFLFNKLSDSQFVEVSSGGDYMTIEDDKIIIHLAKIASDNGGIAHLNCIKAPWGGNSTVYSAALENVEKPVVIEKTIAVGEDFTITLDGNLMSDHIPYNYIRIQLADDKNGTNGRDISSMLKVLSASGEETQGDYINANAQGMVNSSNGLNTGGLIVSSSTFVVTLPNRNDYANKHLLIYLSRGDAQFNKAEGTYVEPTIEKTYDYTIWMAGDESQAQLHRKYVSIDVDNPSSVFEVTLDESQILTAYNKEHLTDFQDFYIRWYVADKVTHKPIADENGNPLKLSTVLSHPTAKDYTNDFYHQEDVGLVWFLGNNASSAFGQANQGILGVHVNLPNGLTQNDVEMVALITTDFTQSGYYIEPKTLEHKVVVKFIREGEDAYMDQPFRHYKGVTGRDWVTPQGSMGTMTQTIWTASSSYNKLLPTTDSNNPLAGSGSEITADIRQGVHTWEYNVYFSPADGQRALLLPFENYMYGYQNGINADGNDLEPRAYFRWYDWKTDMAVNNPDYTMTAVNPDILKPYTESDYSDRNRGLIALNLDPDQPTHGRIGVWFQVNSSFTKEKYPNGIDIACDVSKYTDGINIIGTNAYLDHEPTLSMRYIFHIYPAELIADELEKAKTNLSKARVLLENPDLEKEDRLELYTTLENFGRPSNNPDENINPMFSFPENRGRMVVSLGEGKKGNFSLRLDEHALVNYKMWDVNNSNTLVNADHVKWVAFYEDEKTGKVMRKELKELNTSFIQTFTYSDFQGDYYPLGWEIEDDMIAVNNGMRFHVVGYVTSGTVNTLEGTGTFAPVAHYEIQFLVAPPIPVISLRDNVNNLRALNVTRTDEYLKQNYDLKAVVDFDGNPETNDNVRREPYRKHYFYSSLDDNTDITQTQLLENKSWDATPTTRANNMSWLPREWSDIEYSYTYPQLVNYVIDSHTGWWCYNNFLSPFHGDYMILKSMNIENISTQRTEPYKLQWWDGRELRDYTYVMSKGAKSGSFLYTDASNESRTMITIPFEADLCGGSSVYFTAAVADKTDAQIKPQLLVRIVGVDEDGNHVKVVSFHTCDINTTKADEDEIHQWFQIYGECTIPATFDDAIDHFICEVVNYADNTNGADFAIDHFQIYTNTAKVKISQSQGACDDPATNKMFIFADAEGLQAIYGKTGTTRIYWRIHDEHGEVVTAVNMYDDSDDTGEGIYGKTGEIPLNYTNHLTYDNSTVTEAVVKEHDDLYWFVGNDGKVYCKIAYRYLPGLLDGTTYYVSVYDPARQRSEIGFVPENNSYWGGLNTAARSKCSVFSPFFIPRQQFVIYYTEGEGGGEGGHIMMSCNEAPVVTDMKMMLKKPELSEASGFLNITEKIHFDYFFGTIQQWNNTTETFTYNNTQYKFADLKEAWQKYRVSNEYYNVVGNVHSDFNETLTSGQNARTVLQAAVDAGLMALDYSYTFSNNFNTRPSKDFTVVCLPIEQTIPDVTPTTTICSPFVVKFDIVWPSPDMELGFTDVEYPQREGFHRTIRIGLEQLYNLRKNGYKLHVPIHDFKNKAKLANSGTTIYFEDALLKVSKVDADHPTEAKTNDPIGPAVGANFARLLSPETGWNENGENPFVDADHMFLVLDLSGSNCAINFHEGYSYEVNTRIWDKADDQDEKCYSDIFLTIKVVPEYVTWNPQALGTQTAGGVDYYNVNWNNDANWNRSERAEMYMDDANTHQHNTPSAWRMAATTENLDKTTYYGNYYYKNDTEIDENLNSAKAFVPMKFTYVTMPAGRHAPSLINMEIQAYSNSQYNGGALLAGNLITDPSPYDSQRKVNSPPTADIVYDILVRYSEKNCQGHLQSDNTVYRTGTYVDNDHQYEKVYDCEKFYGNICKEIYFKPGAELINQQRMTYERAWVEKELDANKWYLMSAPLKATFAGDMYVPKADGKQTTEAFQDITFNTTSYSRTKYPFYQRSWDHGTGTNGSIVYTETTDPRHQYYDADLQYSGTLTQIAAQWSHAFNDVQVRYDNPLLGFAIRTKQTGTPTEKALLRLPKADMFGTNDRDWYYYNYDNTEGTVHHNVTKGAKEYGRFITEDENGKPLNNKADITKTLVANTNTGDSYFLVGNPYMASLDMEKFFTTKDENGAFLNSHLVANTWWTIDDNGNPVAGQVPGRVKPMQAFFIKMKDGADPTTPVRFINDMMVDGNDGTAQSGSRRPRLQMKATKDGVTSTAILELNDSATNDFVVNEDVETLFDSNLSDVPMIYTVASDGMALSINQLPEIVTVPFGVTCSSDELVEVTVDLSTLTLHPSPFTTRPSPLFVFDALLGTTRAISDGETISIQPNDYGRYYLTTNEKIGSKEQNADDDIVISVRQGGVVTVSAQGQLSLVRAVSVSGATVYEKTDCGTSTEFRLQQGTYVIETAGDAGRRTIKILVR